MIEAVEFTAAHRCFKRGKRFRFGPGVNVLVGENGAGKSTVLAAIVTAAAGPPAYISRPAKVARWERNNPFKVTGDTAGLVSWDSQGGNLRHAAAFGPDAAAHLGVLFSSTGQGNAAQINRRVAAAAAADRPSVLVLDEPDSSLSLRNVAILGRLLGSMAGAGWQVIIATHHPDLIGSVPKVIDLDRGGRVVNATTYLAGARGTDG